MSSAKLNILTKMLLALKIKMESEGTLLETNEKQPQNKTVGSVQKAANILELLSRSEVPLGVTEISREMDCGVSATYHLLNTLKSCRFITQDEHTKKYSIGIGLMRICNRAHQQNILRQTAQPYMDKLSRISDENCNLIVLDGLRSVYVAQSVGSYKLQMFTQIGGSAPYYCTGAGKTILAFRPEKDWKRFADNTEFVKYTDTTINSAAALMEELHTIRREGIGRDQGEYEAGIYCIAAPVMLDTGEPVAAISLSGPQERIQEKESAIRLPELIRSIADELSAELNR